MNRLNRICGELDAIVRLRDVPMEEAYAASDAFGEYNSIRLTVRRWYDRGGPVVWYNYCDTCGNIWPHPDQSSKDCDFEHPCPACGRSFDRLLVVDEGDPDSVRMLAELRMLWDRRRMQEAVAVWHGEREDERWSMTA